MKLIYFALPLCLMASCKPSNSPEASQKDGAGTADASVKPETLKEKVSEPVGDDRFVGMAVKEAEALAKKDGVACRVVSVDGKSGMITMDHRPDRLNFTVVDGKITKVTRG